MHILFEKHNRLLIYKYILVLNKKRSTYSDVSPYFSIFRKLFEKMERIILCKRTNSYVFCRQRYLSTFIPFMLHIMRIINYTRLPSSCVEAIESHLILGIDHVTQSNLIILTDSFSVFSLCRLLTVFERIHRD